MPSTTSTKEIQIKDWNKSRIHSVVDAWKAKHILVVGDVGIDRYTLGKVERISPEAPVPIVLVEEEKLKLGLAANVADNLRVLGGKAQLLGVVGKDNAAQDLRTLLSNAGLDAQALIEDASRKTILKERIVSERQQLLRIDYESQEAMSAAILEKVFEKFKSLMAVDAVIIQDYAKGLCAPGFVQKLLAHAGNAKKPVFVDPHLKSSLESYRGAFLLTPNRKEAEALSGITLSSEASIRDAAVKISRETQASHVIITLGKDGMHVHSREAMSFAHIPTYAREVYDVSGAGDTVIAILSLALMSGATLEEAAIIGNIAAGIEVGKRGTATVSPQEIFEWVQSN